ncbi:MAG: histidine kinase [Flavipsychrobacter sp.]|nr:histidine kinase [Flavipsychrobacter sp.]
MLTDKYIVLVFIGGTVIFVLFVFFLIAYLLVQKNKQNVFHLEKQRMIYDHQNKLLNTKLEEQELVMEQISKEIHDNLGQVLSFLKMNTGMIRKMAVTEQQEALVDKHAELLTQLIKDIRNISHTLNSDYIKGKGLHEILKSEFEYLNATRDIKCNVEVIGSQNLVSPEKQLIIYRIAQEAVHNTVKHAKATEISIILNFDAEGLTMTVKDNGVGFEKEKIFSFDGIGFINMFNRAKHLNGHLDIQSEQGKGCAITLTANYSDDKTNLEREDFSH